MTQDIFGLTKLNDNACRLGDAEPVTVGFSDAVGEILIANPTVKDLTWQNFLEPRPETAEGLAGSFAGTSHRVLFAGHFHRWLAATPSGLTAWDGNGPIELRLEERYLNFPRILDRSIRG